MSQKELFERLCMLGLSNWLMDALRAEAAIRGQSIRRRKRDVHNYSSREQLIRVARALNWKLIEHREDYILLCSEEPLIVIH